MKYFRYVKNSEMDLPLRVHVAIQNCKPIAMSKYKTRWEDALDDAYFHVLEHYDESQGSLEHYAMRIVNTIYMNKYSKEVGSDVVYNLESDKYAIKEISESDPYSCFEEEDIEYSDELANCIQYLLPFFIKDYELFRSKDGSNRKLNYSGLFDLFSPKVIMDAVNILGEDYYEHAKHINTVAKNCHVRNFDKDRYKQSIDKTIIYINTIGNIVKCRATGKRIKKYAYMLDIQDTIDKLYTMFYSSEGNGIAQRTIYGKEVYCTLSGKIVYSKEDLYEALEREIVGTILSIRSNLRVLDYKRGFSIILSSTRCDEPSIILQLFKTGIYLPIKRMVIGKVEV